MNRSTLYFRGFSAVILFLAAGCATETAVRVGTRTISFGDVAERIDANANKLRTLRGEASLSVETASFSQSGTLHILLQRPDSLLLSITGPFGIRFGTAFVTPTSFRFYSSLQNTEYFGSPTKENLRRLLQVDLSYDDVLSLFTGGKILLKDRKNPSYAQAEGDVAVFRFTDEPNSREYRVDGETMMIRQFLLLDSLGAPVVEQMFERYERFDDVLIPRSIRTTFHKTRRRVSVFYESIETNLALAPMQIDVPSSANRVELK